MARPVIIENLISDWPALSNWKVPSFWTERAGHRFFPVEIGRNYKDDIWTQEIIQLNEYFKNYVFNKEQSKIAYIAQHNWIHQIPDLCFDFTSPDLCEIFSDSDRNSLLTHMWFGMRGTCSPLHFDANKNIFSQVVGSKQFILVDPRFSTMITDGFDNTCKIDSDDLLEYLIIHDIPYQEFILKPGESLYIPFKWWHQVKSLSFSISISFWF